MKSFLLIGDSSAARVYHEQITRDRKNICLRVDDMYDALRLLYEKNIDVILISAKSIHGDRLDFVDFIDRMFGKLKMFVFLDNGFDSFARLPERVQFISAFEYCEIEGN